MAKRAVYTTSLSCRPCHERGHSTKLRRLRAEPSSPPKGLSLQQINERYNILYCTDCDGALGSVAAPSERNA